MKAVLVAGLFGLGSTAATAQCIECVQQNTTAYLHSQTVRNSQEAAFGKARAGRNARRSLAKPPAGMRPTAMLDDLGKPILTSSPDARGFVVRCGNIREPAGIRYVCMEGPPKG